jgi:CRISPR-associated protein Csm2
MNQPNKPFKPNQAAPQSSTSTSKEDEDIVTLMTNKISLFKNGLKDYQTRELVDDTEKLGQKLAKDLKTTQIRKFLDAVNRLKARIRGASILPEDVKSELHLLRPKLAYAAARQSNDRNSSPVEPLKKVLDAALKKDMDIEDFSRFVQLIEAIVAYHKGAGGKD